MSKPFHRLPFEPTIPLKPFTADIPQNVLDDLKRRVEDTPEIRDTYENLGRAEQGGEDLGIKKDWLSKAITKWKGDFDWRSYEKRINSFPAYHAEIELNGVKHQIHFTGLFSDNKDAQAIIMTHGWPGSFLEFLPLLEHLAKHYDPQTLPVHLVVPSLIGYGYSSAPPLDRNFTTRDNAVLFNALMEGLGLKGYIAQGGDIGSFVSRYMASFDSCKAIHVNFWNLQPGEKELDKSNFDEVDRKAIDKLIDNGKWAFAYKDEHATKTATIATVVATHPVSLLAWIGEKMLAWSHAETAPSLDMILANITLYWITSSFPTSLYHYRTTAGKAAVESGKAEPGQISKPAGYSHFVHELVPTPISWIKSTGAGNLVWSKRHERGGHFAALEVPEDFWEDIEAFIKVVK